MRDKELEIKERFFKSASDKILATVSCVILMPLFCLIAFLSKLNGLLIAENRGPIFFRIERISKGKVILLIKFRTVKMKHIREILTKEDRIDDIKLLEKNDKNLTWLGRYLKDFYVDELPQIFNILRGEISFVGPRPYPLSMYNEDLQNGILRKKVIRAGLTGLVQINKAKIKSKEEEIALDLEYIEKVRMLSSVKLFFYDLWIIYKSFAVVFKGAGL